MPFRDEPIRSWLCSEVGAAEDWQEVDQSLARCIERTAEMSHEFDVTGDACFFRVTVEKQEVTY